MTEHPYRTPAIENLPTRKIGQVKIAIVPLYQATFKGSHIVTLNTKWHPKCLYKPYDRPSQELPEYIEDIKSNYIEWLHIFVKRQFVDSDSGITVLFHSVDRLEPRFTEIEAVPNFDRIDDFGQLLGYWNAEKYIEINK